MIRGMLVFKIELNNLVEAHFLRVSYLICSDIDEGDGKEKMPKT